MTDEIKRGAEMTDRGDTSDQPVFQYYSIQYNRGGRLAMHGAYADKSLAQINANLNEHLEAKVVEVWY